MPHGCGLPLIYWQNPTLPRNTIIDSSMELSLHGVGMFEIEEVIGLEKVEFYCVCWYLVNLLHAASSIFEETYHEKSQYGRMVGSV